MSKLIVRRAAQLDVRSIREWYEGNEAGLGDRFLAELDAVVGRVPFELLRFRWKPLCLGLEPLCFARDPLCF